MHHAHARRRLLQFLATSPLLGATLSPAQLWAQITEDRDYLAPSPEFAANVWDMENLARSKLNPGHWTYISQGVDDDLTLHANHEAYQRLHLKARRLVDVRQVDTSITLFGDQLRSPILLAPIGGLGMAHQDGEVEAARGARESGHRQVLSTAATFGIEEVVEARGEPVWFQLYANADWGVTQQMVRKVEQNGSQVMFLTVDIPARNQDRMRRFDRSAAECQSCHAQRTGGRAIMRGIDVPPGSGAASAAMDWDYVKRLKDFTNMRLVIKGLTLAEDAELAVEAGVDGILVSNHGGRADESGYATIDSLPEVVAAVNGRTTVLVDGGIRRGTDVLKAFARGADAVLVGRPYVWGVAAFGAAGVTRVMRILDAELEVAMKQAGITSLAQAGPQLLREG